MMTYHGDIIENITSLHTKLQKIHTSKNYLNIDLMLITSFDSQVAKIIEKWKSNDTLSNEEKHFFQLYSEFQLTFIEYCLPHADTNNNIRLIIEKIPGYLFNKGQIDTLISSIDFIYKQNSNDYLNENDFLIDCIVCMIDSRALAYGLCFENVTENLDDLRIELRRCLTGRQAKTYLRQIAVPNGNQPTISIDNLLNSRHRFFLGCCTFGFASLESNAYLLESTEEINRLVCLYVKYIREILRRKSFSKNTSVIYCLRGILILLTNCIQIEHWLPIMNNALKNDDDDEAQQKNPFNIDLFSLIVNRLLGSRILQKKIVKTRFNNEILLIDAALAFLMKWSDTRPDFDEDEQHNIADNQTVLNERSELLNCLRYHDEFSEISQIIMPFTGAKYCRIRLVAVSILSNVLSYDDFEDLDKRNSLTVEQLIELIFKFIEKSHKTVKREYMGTPFALLLQYLYRFLVQDFVKKQTLPYVSQLVSYARENEIYALKILRRISTYRKLHKALKNNIDIVNFLNDEIDSLYGANPKLHKIAQDINQNLSLSYPKEHESVDGDGKPQAFMSYSSYDKETCCKIIEKLESLNIFNKIWIDRDYTKDDMIGVVEKNIKNSQIVCIFLSDDYCQSDFCRREFNLARHNKKKIYFIIVQNHFKRNKYDQFKFCMENTYYHIFNEDDVVKTLLADVDNYIKAKLKSQEIENNNENGAILESRSSFKTRKSKRAYLKKRSIALWTTADVQDWCHDKGLSKWCERLTNFDGENLLVLRKELYDHVHKKNLFEEYQLDVFDVARFKSELEKIVEHIRAKSYQRSTKHLITKAWVN